MPWTGSLNLHYRLDPHTQKRRTVVHDRHDGPLRVLASLYPEDASVCHNVLVHPPGGLVGGDELKIGVTVDEGAHALITTPGATRFYRSTGDTASQLVDVSVAPEARLEWLPLESLVYSGAIGNNRMKFALAEGAEMIGWDLVALGLPASGRGFKRGRYTQHIELPFSWLERGTIDSGDSRLLDSPLGLNGNRAFGTLWFATGQRMAEDLRSRLVDAARDLSAGTLTAGVTSPNAKLVLLRVATDRIEPAMRLMSQAWAQWRTAAWSIPAIPPRVWRT